MSSTLHAVRDPEQIATDMDQPWRALSACRGKSRLMDPPGGFDGEENRDARNTARAICDACPVLSACALWVSVLAEQDDPGGMCAAMTPRQRTSRRRAVKCAAKPPVTFDPASLKTCTQCGETKPLHEFYANRNAPDGRRADCASCASKRNRERARNKRSATSGPDNRQEGPAT